MPGFLLLASLMQCLLPYEREGTSEYLPAFLNQNC